MRIEVGVYWYFNSKDPMNKCQVYFFSWQVWSSNNQRISYRITGIGTWEEKGEDSKGILWNSDMSKTESQQNLLSAWIIHCFHHGKNVCKNKQIQ